MNNKDSSFDVVSKMVRTAEGKGRLVEVVWSFGMLMSDKRDQRDRISDKAIKVAAQGALADWEC